MIKYAITNQMTVLLVADLRGFVPKR